MCVEACVGRVRCVCRVCVCGVGVGVGEGVCRGCD